MRYLFCVQNKICHKHFFFQQTRLSEEEVSQVKVNLTKLYEERRARIQHICQREADNPLLKASNSLEG